MLGGPSVALRYRCHFGKKDLTEERARLASAQADKTEMENAVTKGELLKAEDYRSGAMVIAKTIATRVLSIGYKLQHKLAAEKKPSGCRKLVDGAAREALEELSQLELRVNEDGSRDPA